MQINELYASNDKTTPHMKIIKEKKNIFDIPIELGTYCLPPYIRFAQGQILNTVSINLILYTQFFRNRLENTMTGNGEAE